MAKKLMIRKSHIMAIVVIFCFLFNSGHFYILANDIYAHLSLAFLAGLLLVVYGPKKRFFIKSKIWLQPFMILSIWIIAVMFLTFEVRIFGSYLRQILVLIVSTLVAINIKFKTFRYWFVRFMVFVTAVAIVVWIWVNVLSLELPLPNIKSTWEKTYFPDYKNGFIVFVYIHMPNKLMGPFWEPGLFATMACYALLLNTEYDTRSRKSKRRHLMADILFVVGILLTLSTAGYILIFIVVLIRYLSVTNKNFAGWQFMLIMLIVVTLFMFQQQIVTFLSATIPSVFGKLTVNSVSKTTRFNGPLVDLTIFFQHPVIGTGMQRYLQIWPTYADILGVESRTSSITYFIANFGILGLLFPIEIARGVMNQKKINWNARTLLMLLIVLILSKEPHFFNLMSCTLIAYLYNSSNIFVGRAIEVETLPPAPWENPNVENLTDEEAEEFINQNRNSI